MLSDGEESSYGISHISVPYPLTFIIATSLGRAPSCRRASLYPVDVVDLLIRFTTRIFERTVNGTVHVS